ncbi:uncharacterized protein BJ212DRAFT_1046467 [Suillus subaureus]|uniref:Uncharacterized protein n=1 Tax=Suillus subaureus TaxID=48587 RepID=A0A9P7JFI9_9AGAM|nr:uncharacterized protein BJ212DRAFT_1046467 [Suillus subaureus]KAG1819474.1 hypothetical protein BJ212DRAFT_1046467 [Suillus subaureus]
MLYLALLSGCFGWHRLMCHGSLSNSSFKRLSFTWPLSVFYFLYNFYPTSICPTTFISMGRSDDNISFGKTYPTMHVPAAQLGSPTLAARYLQRQNISPLLVSGQLRRDTASRSREYVPPGLPSRYYAQSQSRCVAR